MQTSQVTCLSWVGPAISMADPAAQGRYSPPVYILTYSVYLGVDGSILAGDLTSSFCVVPESSYSSNAESSSL